eukprot:793999-Prymnesium_polylepis.1
MSCRRRGAGRERTQRSGWSEDVDPPARRDRPAHRVVLGVKYVVEGELLLLVRPWVAQEDLLALPSGDGFGAGRRFESDGDRDRRALIRRLVVVRLAACGRRSRRAEAGRRRRHVARALGAQREEPKELR